MYVIVVYDVGVKRVGKVCKYLRQHLNWVQNSVFEGEVTKAGVARIKSSLAQILNEDKDSVLIYQMRHERWMNKEVLGVDKNPATNLL
ncbi:MAG: CRISPR-associated endonuclease Cas2 [Gemmatimonadetes bacterium]|nr:CRISPR-associated endonuclease Cas2 [Gemmatimonadota bacterium]